MCRRNCRARSSRTWSRKKRTPRIKSRIFSLATGMDRRYNCGMASTMRELAPAERPRERLLNQGANALKTSELIAILLRTGTSERPVLDLAEFLLTHFGSLEP